MKKKILSLCLVLALGATAIIGGTLAYFTDTDADVNVMSAGNVVIVQNETDRNGDAYQNGQALHPAVFADKTIDWRNGGLPGYDATMKNTNDNSDTAPETLEIWGDSMNNEIDKVISVTNGGTLPAYIRTILLIEDNAEGTITDKIHLALNNDDGQAVDWKSFQVTIEETTYSVGVATYNTALKAGKTSSPSLKQIWLNPTADNEWYEMVGEDGYSIIAFSQAAQTTGFVDAADALNTAFGEVTAENVASWVATTPIKTAALNNVIGAE